MGRPLSLAGLALLTLWLATRADAAAERPKETPAIPTAPAPPPGVPYDDASCASCHAGLTSKKYKHSDLKDGSCADCHLPAERPTTCQGPVRGGWQLKRPDPELCGGCHDKSGDTPLHKIIGLRGCCACHDPHGSDEKKNLKLPKEKLCVRCHLRPADGSVVHAPVREGNCIGCHEPHSGVTRPLLREEKKELCEECHPAKELKGKSHVGATRTCLECHAPHSSDTAGLLRDAKPKNRPKAEDEIAGATYDDKPCNACHAELMGKKFKHSFFRDGTCGDCHLPTGFATGACQGVVEKGWRLKKPQPEICIACHDKSADTPLHPIIGLRGCTACHDPHSADVKKNLKAPVPQLCLTCHRAKDLRKFTHTAVKEGKCTGCHDPHSGVEKPLLKETRKELCFECHDRDEVMKGPEVHTAVREGRCLECHDQHGSENEFNLKAPRGMPLCLSCHDAKKPAASVLPGRQLDLTRAVVHGAITREGCPGCHVMTHSAQVRRLLKKAPPELCYGCHDRKDTHRFTHGAVRVGDCTVCHAQHSSDEKKLLRQKTTAALCFQCHDDDLTGRKFVHKPAAEGQCTRCHDPHGTESPTNLKVPNGKNLCLECHERREEPTVKHAALERYGCVACHDPHGTANRFQLLKPVYELCTGCHPNQADGTHATSFVKDGHKVTGGYDARRNREFSCASCHNPHGSKNPRMFYFGSSSMEMCQGCHGDHDGKHPELVDVTRRRPPPADAGVVTPLVPATMWLKPDAGGPLPSLSALDGGTPSLPSHAAR